MSFSHAQTLGNLNSSAFVEGFDIKGKPFTAKKEESIEGSPMLNDEWAQGSVKFTNRRLLTKVELQFSVYDNELYFRKDNIVYMFADPVKEFSFSYSDNSGSHNVLFRNGYPDFDNRKGSSFYQVLADGSKIQLLKYMYKRISENNPYASPGERTYNDIEELFVYDSAKGKLIRIKSDKTSLIKALPTCETNINNFFSARKKASEDELKSHVAKLNE